MVYLIRQTTGCNPSFVDHEGFEHGSPFRSLGQPSGRRMDLEGSSTTQTELIMHVHGFILATYFYPVIVRLMPENSILQFLGILTVCFSSNCYVSFK